IFKAYNSGGSVLLVSTIVLMIPVAASLVEYVLFHTQPAARHIVAWALTLVAVGLVSWRN
ncbi:MAG: hypothetical protein Q8R32_00050, partial [bacterium]|nr:hypothetical protein [bacterium]